MFVRASQKIRWRPDALTRGGASALTKITFAEADADPIHALLEFGIDLSPHGDFLEMIGRDRESQHEQGDQNAKPEQEAKPDGWPKHDAHSMQ